MISSPVDGSAIELGRGGGVSGQSRRCNEGCFGIGSRMYESQRSLSSYPHSLLIHGIKSRLMRCEYLTLTLTY
jgi:hypothetical protein